MKRLQSYIFVIIQFLAIFYLIYSNNSIYTTLLGLPGVLLAIWSIWEMRKSVLSVFPDPDSKISLIRKGPYSIVRHPMYSSLFLFLIPLVVCNFSIFRILILLVFTVNMVFKLLYEEKLLLQKLPEYKAYMNKTWRLVPLIF